MSGEVRLDAATCPRCRGCGQIASGDEGAPWSDWLALPLGSSLAVLAGIVKPISCPTCNGTGKRAAFSDWVRACEGTALGEPLSWWNDGADGGLDIAACWQPAGRRVVAYLGPQGRRAVEVEGQPHIRCTTPAELRAALEALAREVPS